MKVDWRIILAVITAVTIIECYALSQGINGKVLLGVFVLLGAMAGIVVPSPFTTK